MSDRSETEKINTAKLKTTKLNTAKISAIEKVVAKDIRHRGIGGLVRWGSLEPAARSLSAARKVVVLSGFYLNETRSGETDGPPGAKSVGDALTATGVEVAHVTDQVSLAFYPAMGVPALLFAPEALKELAPSHLLAIERPGRADDGRYYSMSGKEITAHTAPLDDWFLAAPGLGIVTIAIGDGGNEIGMGNVREQVARDVPHGGKIASAVDADHLIVSGVSNFGAYGLAAALSVIAGRDLLPSDASAARAVEACVAAGACCGQTHQNAPLVDGTPLQTAFALLAELRVLIG